MNHREPAFVPAAARMLLASLFLISGFGKLAAPAATKAYILSAGLPLPDVAYLIAVLMEVGLGLALLVGYRTRLVAALMAAFTVATAFAFHAHFADPNQMTHFLKNIAISGGLLQVAAYGAGSFALDALRLRRTQTA
ncbi:DoxX family protein [Rhodanobacter sp. AS-Z3]|uniref:DoxX family protein n=1 Tax=Rhodanobacter sp. AS-Z3 TaxID=3031330 RepID=UPI00247A9600|nr:DoxX family protein [Rhodanobacter sp. AS-Z3]WEN14237.1 DoxX family protein [Rhodanobacter sp. AS-Z3]